MCEPRVPVNSKELKGIPVLSIDGGEKLGSVSRAYVDAPQKRIVGFAYNAGGGFMQTESEPKLDAEEVHTLGPDALMLDKKEGETGASVSERYSQLSILDDVSSLPVLSESGVLAGHVASIDFDQNSYELTQLEVSPGHFKSNQAIPIEHVVTIGRDYVIVQDAVIAPATPPEETEPATSVEMSGETTVFEATTVRERA